MTAEHGGRWLGSDAPRGDAYDARLQARLVGRNPHGEADFVEQLAGRWFSAKAATLKMLDGGCGTGRVSIELARRDFDIIGVDLDPAMLGTARIKAPDMSWLLGDLASTDLGHAVDLAVLAGNVMIFVGRGHEGAVLSNIARQITPGGLLVAGFQIQPGGLDPDEYDALAATAGLEPVERWSTWDRAPWTPASSYVVLVHRAAPAQG